MRARILMFGLVAGLVTVVTARTGAQPQTPGFVPAPAAAPMPTPPVRKLQLSFDGAGNVTLVAENVTLREILAEWSRVGGSRFDGAERLAGGPVSFRFDHAPEVRVVESLFRSAAGFGVLPRAVGSAGASRIDVRVVATSRPTSMYTGTGSSAMTPPSVTNASPDDEIPPVTQAQNPQAPAQTTAAPPPASRTAPGVVPIAPVVISPVTPGQTGRGGGGGGR